MNETLLKPSAMKRLERHRSATPTYANPRPRVQGYITRHPTSKYRVFATLQEAEAAVEWARVRGYPGARVADGFQKRPRAECLWIYERKESHPDGRSIVVYAYCNGDLLYLRENGEFQ